jgi:hypothetical protein
MLQQKFEWNDYFTATPVTTISKRNFDSKQTPSDPNVHILNCLFNNITSTSGDGGALYCTSVTYLLVESSSFFSCKTSSSYGGAIYFYNQNNGECVLYEVCGNDCYTTYNSGTSYGQFAYIAVRDVASSKNYINFSSIARCVNENSNSQYTSVFSFGKILCPSVNISLNKCNCHSGIYCYPFNEPSSVVCSLSYSSFSDNNATGYNCIWFNREGAKCEIKSCNILRNTQGSLDSWGTIRFQGKLNLIISDSCILENNATYIFSSTYSKTVTLSNCTIDKTTCNQNIITQNTVTKSFILALNHMSTQNCHSEYDSVGTLTPIVQLPSSFVQSQLRDLVSLISVFLFIFIHHDDSNDPWY